MLPHLHDRPLTVQRFPGASAKKGLCNRISPRHCRTG
ncbi:hypothetical protein [Mycobacterium tilburgii]